MGHRNGDRVVHSYDVGRRQVLCGCPEQTSSTKHAAGVTCPACRELLDRARSAGRAPSTDPRMEAPAAYGE